MSDEGDPSLSGVVLVTVDSLRADALDPQVAPTLSRLAEGSTTFDRAFAHGNWTPFSFPSILGSKPVFSDDVDVDLADSPTLAEALSRAGVETAGFNAANGFLTEHWGYDRGFDRFESFIEDPDGLGSKYLAAHPTVNGWVQLATSPVRRLSNRLRRNDPKPFVDVSHCWDVERRATDFIGDAREPFFLWAHYMDAHTPYVPAPRHVRAVGATRSNLLTRLRAHLHTGLGRRMDRRTLSALRSLYRATIHQVDASVGRLLSALEANGLRDSTLVVVTGDHGEEFQDHGHLAHYPKLYDELVRVPLLIDHPGAGGRRVPDAVGLDSIPPTICSALGAPAGDFDGPSVLPTVQRGDSLDRRPVTSTAVRGATVTQQPIPRRLDDGEVLVSARTDRYTYIYYRDTGRAELYDRATDADERHDLLGSTGPTVPTGVIDRLHGAVERRLAQLHSIEGGATPDRSETPPELELQLQALGYR